MKTNTLKQQLECAVYFAEISSSPENVLNLFLENFINIKKYQNTEKFFLLVPYFFTQPWNEEKVSLLATYFVKSLDKGFDIESFCVEIFDYEKSFDNQIFFNSFIINDIENKKKITITVNFDISFYHNFENNYIQNFKNKVCLKTKEPFVFDPIYIQKPWGQEIWYTGVEKRGVSKIKSFHSDVHSIPMTWVFSALPKLMQGELYAGKNLTLIKILDPLSDEVFGDLYYELHTEKNEVYIVTNISSQEGQIKIGADLNKLQSFLNPDEYKKSFLESIKRYEEVRRKIDFIFDDLRRNEGIPLDCPISSEKIKGWHFKIPQDLSISEKKLRQEMDSYAGYLKLNVGDVVRVPIRVPHALQHGVRVIEFQTPTYERMIISFAQKVLTQAQWNTEEAFSLMEVSVPQKSNLELIQKNEDFIEEMVCSFNEFYSTRIAIQESKNYLLQEESSYRILFVVSGEISLKGKEGVLFKCKMGKCVFLPAKINFQLHSYICSVLLICYPK